ncbi:MAG: protein-tyrosine phosphatase family protein [Paracoccaceae bacterium]
MIEPFRLFPVALPRGRLMLCRLPGRSGDLAGDVATIASAGVSLVVSLTEATELADLGVADLPIALKNTGLAWRSFPVPDFGTPPTDADWAGLSLAIHERLAQGQTILVHCRGGLGRSGMVVLRVMIESGEDPASALARLREIRPGAVETPEQEAWAHRR